MSAPRYLLVKAHVGFGDRLQCLSHALQYATKYKRHLCVDWTDEIWSDGTVDFYTYFDLCNVPMISRAGLLRRNVSRVHPPGWANQLERAAESKFIYKDAYVNLLTDEDHPAEVVVYPGTGFRKFFQAGLCQLRVKREFRDLIVEQLREFSHLKTVVHLRGTDRVAPDRYADYVQEICQKMHGYDRQEPLLVVSDCLPLFERFQAEFPQAVLRTEHLFAFNPIQGTHVQKEVTKHTCNIELLTDFFLLMYAPRAIHDSRSLFSKMARFIRGETEDYCDVLGYDPESTERRKKSVSTAFSRWIWTRPSEQIVESAPRISSQDVG